MAGAKAGGAANDAAVHTGNDDDEAILARRLEGGPDDAYRAAAGRKLIAEAEDAVDRAQAKVARERERVKERVSAAEDAVKAAKADLDRVRKDHS